MITEEKIKNKSCLDLFQKKHVIELILSVAEDQPVRFNLLQERLSLNTATLQRRLEDLQERGFIVRTPCKIDTRSVYYSLTRQGTHVSKTLTELRSYLIGIDKKVQ